MHAIRALVASGASVLVAAYTNSALDNILIKLADAGLQQFLRLGRPSSCHPAVRQYLPGGERCVWAEGGSVLGTRCVTALVWLSVAL